MIADPGSKYKYGEDMSKRSEKSKKGRKVASIVENEDSAPREGENKNFARLVLGRMGFRAMERMLWDTMSDGQNDEILLMRMARDVSAICEDGWNIGMLSKSLAQIVVRVSAEYKPEDVWYEILIKLAKRTLEEYSAVRVVVRNATSHLDAHGELVSDFDVELCD